MKFLFPTVFFILLSFFASIGCKFGVERDSLQLINALGLFPSGSGLIQVGGNVSGLEGSGLTLRLNSGEELEIVSNGSFRFTTGFTSGQEYSVSVASQPTGPDQSCTIQNGTGTIESRSINDINITCLNIPIITSISPGDFSNITTVQSIVIRFSKTMNTNSCNLNSNSTGSLLNGNAFTATWSETDIPNDTLTISPDTAWNTGISRVLHISGCADTVGLVAGSGGEIDLERIYFVTQTVGALRFVTTSGSDSGSCTEISSPCATIEYAYGELSAVTDCGANSDCAVLVGSGDYSPNATINLQTGRSIIGSFNSTFTGRNINTSATRILPENLPACGGSTATACRTVFVSGVTTGTLETPGTRLETIFVSGRANVAHSHAIRIADNSILRLQNVQARAGDTNEANAATYGLLVQGNSIQLSFDLGVYTSATQTGTGSTSSAIRIDNSSGVALNLRALLISLRDAPTRHGIYLSNSANFNFDMRFATISRGQDLGSTNESYGIRIDGTLNGSTLVLGNNNIRSFSAINRSRGLYLESQNSWGMSPASVIYNNQITGGRIDSGAGNSSYGVYLDRFGGKLINNRIVGGQLTDTVGGDVYGIRALRSQGLRLYQNSIASGSGDGGQRSMQVESLGAGDSNGILFDNNNFASNTNSTSVCVAFQGANAPTGVNFRNNNFHRCSGGHVAVDGVGYFRSNCAGTIDEGDLSSTSDCANPLGATLGGNNTGNIDVSSSFVSANPTDLTVNVWDWNLRLNPDGTTSCSLARGALELTSAIATPVNVQNILNQDRINNPRTNSDISGITGLPSGASGRSIGSYEFNGDCQ